MRIENWVVGCQAGPASLEDGMWGVDWLAGVRFRSFFRGFVAGVFWKKSLFLCCEEGFCGVAEKKLGKWFFFVFSC